MKIIASAETFSTDNIWIQYEIYKHGDRYRIEEQECGLGGVDEKPVRKWAELDEVRHLLTMDERDTGSVEIIDNSECDKILSIN